MAEIEVTLGRGIRIGDTVYRRAAVKEATAGDALDAESAAERVYMTPDGPMVQASPARMGFELLARQIARLSDDAGGDFAGAVTTGMLRNLSRADLDALIAAGRALETAAEREALGARGRD